MKIQEVLKGEKPLVLADQRELNSNVVRYLKGFDILVREKQLEVADYIASDRVAVERKTVQDFLQSIIDQRVFVQTERLICSYERPVLIVEGSPDMLFFTRDIHPNAVRGALASIAVDFRVPIIWTGNPRQTAEMIYWLAYREQIGEKRGVQIRCNKKSFGIKERQEFLIAGLPNVSDKLSRRLLKHFKRPKKIFDADVEELMEVEKIGEKKAKKIWDVINKRYEE
jgi:Fanconi anemia group M protein